MKGLQNDPLPAPFGAVCALLDASTVSANVFGLHTHLQSRNFKRRDLAHPVPDEAGDTAIDSPQLALQACKDSASVRAACRRRRGISTPTRTSIPSCYPVTSSILHRSLQTGAFLVAQNEMNTPVLSAPAAPQPVGRHCMPKSRCCARVVADPCGALRPPLAASRRMVGFPLTPFARGMCG
jgi:hypothetical protein